MSSAVSGNGLLGIALLGRRDEPTDALEDYCHCLAQSLRQKGCSIEIARLPWAEQGWRRALREVGSRLGGARNGWILVQYTALSWSKRGFSWRFLSLVRGLKRAGWRVLIVFHEPQPYGGRRLVDRLRRRTQLFAMRRAARKADKIVSTLSPERVSWMREPAIRNKTITLPVGSNLPAMRRKSDVCGSRRPVVAVFGVTGSTSETDMIAMVLRDTAIQTGPLHLTIFGRGGNEASERLRPLLEGTGVEIEDLGVLEPERAGATLAEADVQLFVRSGLTSFRGSAIAGIACGLPVVGFSDQFTEFPITEAGVRLVPRGDRQALTRELVQVLQQPALREELRQRSLQAAERYFSWDRIAEAYLDLLRT